MALTKVSRGLLSTSIVDNGNATAITIDANENVGIGTGTPGCKVDIVAADNTSLSPTLRVNSNNVAVNAALAYDGLVGSGEFELRTSGASALKFGTNATTRMLIDSSGNLLVGKTSADVGATAGIELYAQANKLAVTRASGVTASFNLLTDDGTIVDFKKDGLAVGSIGTVAGDMFVGTSSTGVRFLDANNEIIPITVSSGGGSTDGTISLGGSPYRFKDLYLSGQWVSNGSNNTLRASFQVSGTQYGYINVATTGTLYSTTSDYRIKENVVALTNATERLKQLNPLRFSFIPDQENTIVDGFFAHEVADVVPEAIIGAKDAMRDEEYEVTPAVLDDDGNVITEAVMGTRSVPDYQGIDQSKLVPLLVATIQELEARITQLENN